ncbi:MAG: tetratricopeptide repeat protein [Nitrospirales bacterium]
MTTKLLPFLKEWNLFRSLQCKTIVLTTLILLASSTALGNHLDTHDIFDVTKPNGGVGLRQDPTLQNFWVLPNTAAPKSRETKAPEVQFDPNYSVSSPPPGFIPDQIPVVPHMKLGWKFLVNGQPDAAMAAYRQALTRHPHSANALLGMGMTLKTLGKMDEAKEAITQALELNPQLAPALVHLGYLYADGQLGAPAPDTASHLFQQAQQIGDPFARIALLELRSRPSL